ncbi:MAG: hypothetical protein CM15mP103_09820 [Gammaproteobacteria bacterium]|nr:MAG: hypothetical protein CM15mP103_09820 [Gammaproteobacteria bacterium]
MRRLWFATPLTSLGGVMLGLIGGVLLAPAFPAQSSVDGARADYRGVQYVFGEGFQSQ